LDECHDPPSDVYKYACIIILLSLFIFACGLFAWIRNSILIFMKIFIYL